MNKYLFVTRGLPGSGKTTFVANIFTGNSNTKIICPDQLRNEERKRLMKRYIHQLEPINEHKIWKTAYALLEESLQKNKYTVFDATNTLEKYLNTYNKYCLQYGVKLVIISFESVDYDLCKSRNKERLYLSPISFVPPEVLERMNRQLGYKIQGETKAFIIDYKDFNLENYQ